MASDTLLVVYAVPPLGLDRIQDLTTHDRGTPIVRDLLIEMRAYADD